MRKRWILPIIFLIGILCLTACNKTADTESTTEEPTQEEKQAEEQGDSSTLEERVEANDAKEMVEEPVSIKIYFSNDDATAFLSEEVTLSSLSPEEVLEALIEKGAVAADVQILSFETTTVEDKSTIVLDLNDAFSSYISNMGSTGEYYVMGSVCNTFLDAYDCEQIQITVDGKTLSTGHAEYPGYMTEFK